MTQVEQIQKERLGEDLVTEEQRFDENDFLKEIAQWNREVASILARRNDIGPLTDDHWKVIEYVREYYLDKGEGPPIVRIGKATGLSMKSICELFPCGVVRGAYRLAGLPKPPGCL